MIKCRKMYEIKFSMFFIIFVIAKIVGERIMLEIKNLYKSYGSRIIIENWSYQFQNGKIYGLIGRNGIGKTTILKCMCGLLIPNKAEIISDKGDLSREDYLNRDIIYVSDEPIYYHNLTVQEHFWLVCKVENYTQEEAQKAISFYTNKLHMQEYLNYYPSALSKGTLQRMMLIMGFLRRKPNLLLDEPFNGLDPVQLEEIIQMCDEERKKRCMIISSHDIESLAELCDEYIVWGTNGIKVFSGKIDRKAVNQMIGDSYV